VVKTVTFKSTSPFFVNEKWLTSRMGKQRGGIWEFGKNHYY